MNKSFLYKWLLVLLVLTCPGSSVLGATVEEVANLKLGPERNRVLEQGARREGRLMIYATSSGYKKVAAAFMKEYPFIKTGVFTSRGEPLTQRVLAEARVGRLGADLLRTNVNVYENLSKLLVPFKSPHADFDLVPKAAPYSYGGIGFAYSKERVKENEIPQKVEDLLAPRWKDRIGLFVRPNNYPARWVGTLIDTLGEERTQSFLKKLGDQNPHFYVRPAAGHSGLLAGEFDINMQGLTSGYIAMTSGQPSGILALDPTTLSSNVVGIFGQSKNPHAAMLFIDWVLGKGAPIATKVKGEWTPAEVKRRQKGTVKLPKRIRIEKPSDADHLKDWMALFQHLVAKK